MSKLKITNACKHSLVAIWAATILGGLHRLAWAIDPSSRQTMHLWWFIIFAGIILIVNVERNQLSTTKPARFPDESLLSYYRRWYKHHLLPRLKVAWLDIVADIVIGIASMFAGLLPWWIL